LDVPERRTNEHDRHDYGSDIARHDERARAVPE
jgi:hypothetical protein